MFKRYINKHGKKLGPYYYHNVRGNDGKIRSIYVGTNPQNHPKHKIRKPLFFLILVLILILILGGSLFFLQNKAVLLKKSENVKPNFDVDQILLKVLVKSGDYLEKQIRVMNTGNEPAAINLEIPSISDIVSADSNNFSLKPGQTKIVTLNFSSVVPNQKIEQQPGIYVGKLILKSGQAQREVPIVVEIETKDVLFDMNLNPVAIERKVKQGEDTTIEVKVFNLESIESVNVDVEYFVKDMNGNTIVTESETVVVKSQASFFKTISIPKNLNPGPYVFAAKAKFGNSVGTSSYMFEVTGPEIQQGSFAAFCKSSVLCLGLSMTTILLIFALIAYLYFYVGAFLYEKLTGTVTVRRKKQVKEETAPAEEVPIEKPKQSIFSKIAGEVRKWQSGREKEKLQKEKVTRELELQKIQQRRIMQLEDARKQKEIEARALEGFKKLQILKRQEEIEEKRAEQDRLRREEEAKRLKEAEEERKEKEEKKTRLERQRLIKQKKKDVQNFFHKIGFYKTPEERKQSAIQKEEENQERMKLQEETRKQKELEKKRIEQDRLRREEEAKRLKEAEAKRKTEEERRRKLEEERKLQENIENTKRKETERKQIEEERIKEEKELQEQKALEEKKKAEENKKAKLERQRLIRQKKKDVQNFFHKIGFYKTPEERKQIAIQKEEENQERMKLQEETRKQKELEKKRIEQDRLRREEEAKRLKEAEAKRKTEEERRRKLDQERKLQEEIKLREKLKQEEREEAERKQIEEERKRKEENDRIMEAERIKQAEEKKREEITKQKELERKKQEEEYKNKKLILQKQREQEENRKKIERLRLEEEEKKKKEDELRRREEEKAKQNELEEKRREIERKNREEGQRKWELEERQRKEEESRRKEAEKEKEELIKNQKLELIKDLQEKLAKNKETDQKLNSELGNLEAGNRVILNKFKEIDSQVMEIEQEIEEKSSQLDKIQHQKSALIQNHQSELEELDKKQKDFARKKSEKKREINEKLAQHEAKLLKEMERDMAKLSSAKRAGTEKWKKIEVKAKLKLEEQELYGQLGLIEDIFESRDEKEVMFKKTLANANENERNLKKVISGLKKQTEELNAEKKNSPDDITEKESKTATIRKKIDVLDKEREQITKEIAIAHSGISKLRFGYLKHIVSVFVDKREKLKAEKDRQKAKLEAERKKIDIEAQKQKEKNEAARAREVERQKKDAEKKAQEERKKSKHAEKLRLIEENKRQENIEIQKTAELKSLREQRKEEISEAKPEKTIIKNIAGRSRDFERCFNLLESARKELNTNKNRAKELYAKSREIYVGLDYHEKKEIYNELMDLYNKLLK